MWRMRSSGMTFEICFRHERKPLTPARVEDHRLIVNDQILTQIETIGDGVDSQRSIDAVNSLCNLVDCCSGVGICLHDVFPLRMNGRYFVLTALFAVNPDSSP